MTSLFPSFLTNKWRWVAAVLGAIFAVLLLTQGADYTSAWLARHHLRKQVDASQTAADQLAAAKPARQHHFDSTVSVLAGQHREMMRQEAILKQRDEALTRSLPAPPALPAEPPRQ